MKNLFPIRKVAAGLIASAAVFAARKCGVTLGDAKALADANAFVGFVVAYIVPDPRVKRIEREMLSLLDKWHILSSVAATVNAEAAAKADARPDNVDAPAVPFAAAEPPTPPVTPEAPAVPVAVPVVPVAPVESPPTPPAA